MERNGGGIGEVSVELKVSEPGVTVYISLAYWLIGKIHPDLTRSRPLISGAADRFPDYNYNYHRSFAKPTVIFVRLTIAAF